MRITRYTQALLQGKVEEQNKYLHVLIMSTSLFRADVLQLLGRVHEVVGVSLGSELARVGFLNKVLVTLLLSKVNGILL